MDLLPNGQSRSRGNAVHIGVVSDGLARIAEPDVQLAIWQRDHPADLDWLDALDWSKIDDIDTHITGPDWDAEIWPRLREAGYPETADGERLTAELAQRADQFAGLMTSERLRMRLEVVETDACRRFHMDYLSARLLMPLVGPGTQWICVTDGEYPPIQELGAGDVAIFKGRLAVEKPIVLHRSPPVSQSGLTRLLFVLDPA